MGRTVTLLRRRCVTLRGRSLCGALARALLYTAGMRLFLSIALAVSLLSVRAAHACGGGGNGNYVGLYALGLATMVVASGVAAGDIVFSIHDLVDPHPSRASGIGESLLAAPQVLAGVGMLTAYQNTEARIGAAVYTAWMTALLVHGIHTIVTAGSTRAFDEAEEARLQTPGLGLGMTFVDVGQKSAPGLGVVGRF